MRTWIIECKEKWCDHPIRTTHVGNLEREDIIKFFGLNEPDIEWYTIEEDNR
jgi:hypothetical protein